jgi:hypothetical protein
VSDPRFSPAEIEEAHSNAMILARLIAKADPKALQAVLDEMSLMESAMPFFDSTGYIKVGRNIPRHRRVIGAILGAHQEIAAVLDEEQRRR